MARKALRVLLVEDDAPQARLAKATLEAAGFASPTVVTTAAEALAQGPDHDLLLLDVQLPDGNGLDVLRTLRERSARPAVVIVTAHGGERVAVDALRLGADDYVTKDGNFTELLPTVVERIRRDLALRDTLESTEREVVEAERRSAVGEMTVALHHELNNPLMAALTEVSLLKDEPGLSATVRQGLEIIETALDRIRTTVKRAGAADGTQSTDYLAGALKMADLGATGAIKGVRGCAVVVAEDSGLRRVMAVLLRREGFDPEGFEAPEDTVSRLRRSPRPTVVVVAGLPAGGIDPFGGHLDAVGHPWRLVVAAPAGAEGPLVEHADLVLPLPFDPATFGAQVVAALKP